jgi:hypothetical protein
MTHRPIANLGLLLASALLLAGAGAAHAAPAATPAAAATAMSTPSAAPTPTATTAATGTSATATAAAAPTGDLLVGKWEGTWKSSVNDLDGKLTCTIHKTLDGKYAAAFSATYAVILTHKSNVVLTAEPDGARWKFKGEKDLGFFSGGVYTYDGTSDGTDFVSTYDSKYEKGTFTMKRISTPTATATPTAAPK